MSILQVITLIAGKAVSSVIVTGALVTNGHANFVIVEGPSVRASKANLVLPVPATASEIGGGSSVGR